MAAGVTGRFFPVSGLHLGQAGNLRTFNEPVLSGGNVGAGFGPFLGHLGCMIEDAAKVYRLVQYSSGTGVVAMVDGGVAFWSNKSNFVITPDNGSSEAGVNGIAGGSNVAIATGSSLNYCFIQVGGDQAAVINAGSAVAGSMLRGQAVNNQLAVTAAGTAPINVVYAIALSATGTTTSDSGGSIANSSKTRWLLGQLI